MDHEAERLFRELHHCVLPAWDEGDCVCLTLLERDHADVAPMEFGNRLEAWATCLAGENCVTTEGFEGKQVPGLRNLTTTE